MGMTKRSIPPVMAGGIGQKGTWTLHLISYPVSASSHPVSAGRLLITERDPSPNQAAACAKAIVSLCSKPPMVVNHGRRLHIRSCRLPFLTSRVIHTFWWYPLVRNALYLLLHVVAG